MILLYHLVLMIAFAAFVVNVVQEGLIDTLGGFLFLMLAGFVGFVVALSLFEVAMFWISHLAA